MDAVDILKICLRRWYVMLPILLGAAGVSYQLVQAQETTYTAAASYGLVQPGLATAETEAQRNPLGPDGGALIGAALEAQLNSRETQEELGSDATRGWGPGEVDNGSSYSVKIPLYETTYEVRAWGTDDKAVRDVVNRVIKAAPAITEELQDRAGTPATGRYQPFVLAPTQVDVMPSTAGKKLVVAVMGVGVLVGAAWSIIVDRVMRRRVPRERPAPASGSELLSGPDPTSGPDPVSRPDPTPGPDAVDRPDVATRPDLVDRPGSTNGHEPANWPSSPTRPTASMVSVPSKASARPRPAQQKKPRSRSRNGTQSLPRR